MTAPLIEFRDVTKRFNGRTVLDGLNLQIFEGEITTIIGLSGSGKSVLLKHIIGLMKPDQGSILIYGKPLENMKKNDLHALRRKISYMFQGNALFDSMTVYENIALPLRETTDLKKREIDERVMIRIRQMELEEASHSYPAALSGGMQKRVALARALVTDPQIVLFDEPTTGQDPVRKNTILGMIAQYQRKFGFTAILVSHEIPDVYFISNRILALYDRKIVFQGSPEELENFRHPFKDEVIHSLEALQKELTGLYSIRQFKAIHYNQLRPREREGAYTLFIFTLKWSNGSTASLPYAMTNDMVHAVSQLLNKHFSALGGFSTRRQASEFITVLPHADLAEAENTIREFVLDLKEQAICDHLYKYPKKHIDDDSFDFVLLAGATGGQPGADIDQEIAEARKAQKEIFRHRCDLREATQ